MKHSRLRGHAIAIVDQGVSSGTNFLAVLAVARGLDAEYFGVFAMAYTALTLFLGLSRAYFGIPIALGAGDESEKLRRLFSHSFSAACVVAVPIAVLVAITGLVAVPRVSPVFMAMVLGIGLAAPLVILQDVCRYYAIARNYPVVALASDAVWLIGVVVLIFIGPSLAPEQLIAAWTGTVLVSLIPAVVVLRPPFAFRSGLYLLKPRRGLRESVSVTVVLSTGVTLAMGFLMVPFLGPVAVGAIRGAGTLFGPINTVIALLDFSVLGALARRGRGQDGRAITILVGVLAMISALWGGVLLLLPDKFGGWVLGESWATTRGILPVTAIEYVLLSVAAALAVLFKLRNRSGILLVNRIVSSAVILGCAIVFLNLGLGVFWMAVALCAGALVSSVMMLLNAGRERGAISPEVSYQPSSRNS